MKFVLLAIFAILSPSAHAKWDCPPISSGINIKTIVVASPLADGSDTLKFSFPDLRTLERVCLNVGHSDEYWDINMTGNDIIAEYRAGPNVISTGPIDPEFRNWKYFSNDFRFAPEEWILKLNQKSRGLDMRVIFVNNKLLSVRKLVKDLGNNDAPIYEDVKVLDVVYH